VNIYCGIYIGIFMKFTNWKLFLLKQFFLNFFHKTGYFFQNKINRNDL
jgi:hypothetical protein